MLSLCHTDTIMINEKLQIKKKQYLYQDSQTRCET